MSTKAVTKDATMAAEPVREGPRYLPPADIYESANELTLLLDLPGVAPADIDVQVERGVLHIRGKASPADARGQSEVLREYEVGDYYRRFDVGETIDTERIGAEHRDGVLTLHLPKIERARPKRIEVRAK